MVVLLRPAWAQDPNSAASQSANPSSDDANQSQTPYGPGKIVADTRPLSGAEYLTLGIPERDRNVLNASIQADQRADSNSTGSGTATSWTGDTDLYGNAVLNRSGKRNSFTAQYAGGASYFGESDLQSTDKQSDVALAVRVGRWDGNGGGDFAGNGFSVVVLGVKALEAPASADGINMPLSKYRAEPGFEGTAAMKVMEERAFAASALREAIEFREERVGEFASFGRSGAAPEDSGSSSAKIGAIRGDEMFPRGFTVFHAGGGQRQILEMQRREIFVESIRREVSAGEALLRAAFKGSGKSLPRKAPVAGFGPSVEPLESSRGRGQFLGSAEGSGGPAGWSAIWGVSLHGQFRCSQYGRPSNAGGMLGILRA